MQRDLLSFTDHPAAPAPRFCSYCGQPAENKFCSGCGQLLAAAEASQPLNDAPDWRQELRFEVIARVPEVRVRVQASAAKSKKHMTGEEFLAMASSVMPVALPLDKLAGIAQPMYARWGVKTGKQLQQLVPSPVGETLVRVLCSLAQRGQELQGVEQSDESCTLVAAFPSDLLALEGKLLVTVNRAPDGSLVSATTKIEGQYFDWGKSRRGLERLFGDLQGAA